MFFYLLTCLAWAILACKNQLVYYPESKTGRLILTFALNFIFCPFAIIIAIIMFDTLKTLEKNGE
jgi:hypothetical protein